MFTVTDSTLAIALCVLTMIGWGSWANTQKLAGAEDWPFELYYWDYAVGIALFGMIFWLTLGNFGEVGMGAVENLRSASPSPIARAVVSGGLFNVANILLVVAIDAAGMSVAFPVGVGLALVIGTLASYAQAPKGNVTLLASGVLLILVAMFFSTLACRYRTGTQTKRANRGLLFAVAAGILMGFFYPQLMRCISPNFNSAPIEPGLLTPYTALFFFGLGVLSSNLAVNSLFMRAQGTQFSQYLAAKPKLHLLGILGGLIWMIALTSNVIASGVAGPAVSYALGQGATLVAALWGVFIWREFRGAPPRTWAYVALMLTSYGVGLSLIGAAVL